MMFVQTFGMIESAADIPALVELAFDPEYDPDDDPCACFDSERDSFPSTCVGFEFRLNTPITTGFDATACVFDILPGHCYEVTFVKRQIDQPTNFFLTVTFL
ncbi:MAG: hypothetical protein J6I76_01215 [Oribacterium sp.]|nr:hypothetical protein [Oribacterium sp.]